jgi:hypothetical protein
MTIRLPSQSKRIHTSSLTFLAESQKRLHDNNITAITASVPMLQKMRLMIGD